MKAGLQLAARNFGGRLEVVLWSLDNEARTSAFEGLPWVGKLLSFSATPVAGMRGSRTVKDISHRGQPKEINTSDPHNDRKPNPSTNHAYVLMSLNESLLLKAFPDGQLGQDPISGISRCHS